MPVRGAKETLEQLKTRLDSLQQRIGEMRGYL